MSGRVLYLIRHGRSDYAAEDYVATVRGDQFDPPLAPEGKEQAELLARRLLAMDPAPAVVYSSTMRRALETIAPYAERTGVEVAQDEDLMEAHIGEWERKSFEEILETEGMLDRLKNHEPIWRHAPGAEDIDAFRLRVQAAVERILALHPQGNVAVVCHGGVINAYIAPILGLRHEMFFLPENTSLNSVDVDGDARRVRFLNDTLHLSDPNLFE